MSTSRRKFLIATGALGSACAGVGSGQQPSSSEPYADKRAADEWLRNWMGSSLGAASGTLHLSRFADPMYFLTKPIRWAPNEGQKVSRVEVPVGFVTDFASIPRVFWSILPPDGVYTYPAIIHDYLYWEKPVSRAEADLVLRYAMEDFKVDSGKITAIYNGVHFGGQSAWDENAALKRKGERRILKEYPTDPTIRWSEWKLKPGVLV